MHDSRHDDDSPKPMPIDSKHTLSPAGGEGTRSSLWQEPCTYVRLWTNGDKTPCADHRSHAGRICTSCWPRDGHPEDKYWNMHEYVA